MDLLLESVITGVLLGCFYAAVSIGLSVSFGLLDVPQVAASRLSGDGVLRSLLPQ